MAVTRDDVLHIAALARLHLDEAQVPAMVAQLNSILGHMDVLSRVPTPSAADVTTTDQPVMLLRPDGGPPLLLATPRESFAPAMRDRFFLVPRLATHEGVDTIDEGGE